MTRLVEHLHWHEVAVAPAKVNGKQIGHVAQCECGYLSPVFTTWNAAAADADEHRRS